MAPDYLLLSNKIFEKFIAQLKIEIIKMFGKNPIKSNDYGRIIHKDHLDKMKNLIKGQNVIYGGKFNDSELYFEPTIILINSKKNLIMESEIFGPILPIIKYTEESEIKQIIKSFNKPLSFYVFSNRKRWAQNIMQTFSFGGGMINDVIVYFTNERLPFGGVGNSGIGRYHGKFSFETFSHFKPIVKRYTLIDPSFRYPPYGKALSILKKLLSFRFFLM
jgi:aldehyde dehydrogenase (NAD+)